MNEAELKNLISTNENKSDFFGYLVFTGLVLDVLLVLIFPENKHWLEITAQIVADSLIAAGVFGEIYFATRGRKAADELRLKSEERVAEANKRAAEAELATEQLKARFSWRSISKETAQTLASHLSAYDGAVTIEYVLGDPEALYFAKSLSRVFSSAKWNVGMMGETFGGLLLLGLYIPDDNPPLKDLVRSIFQICGMEFSMASIPPSGGMAVGNSIPNSVAIFVGSKPQSSP